MADSKVNTSVFRYLGNPPAQYDQNYMSNLVSEINNLFVSLSRGIDINVASLKIESLQGSTSGLRENMVYLKTLASGEKVLSIVLPGDTY